MKEDIAVLKESLVYQMSLGSKELYHSNVWGWLMETHHPLAAAFGVSEEDIARISHVGREDGNRDISIYLNDEKESVIVIENKLKSIPSIEQLRKYEEGLGNRFKYGILTGIKAPSFVDDENIVQGEGIGCWKFVSYHEIAETLQHILPSGEEPATIDKNRAVILDYIACIHAMERIVFEYVGKRTAEPFWGDGTSDFDRLGLQDLINKLRGSDFIRFFKEKHGKDECDELKIWQSFHHKSNTLDFRFEAKDGFVISIQVEGSQFRRLVQFSNKPSRKNADDVLKQYEGRWFACYDERRKNKERMIWWPGMEGMPTKLTGSYNSYETSDYCFVYQYATLNECQMGFDALFELIEENLTMARELFAEHLLEAAEPN